MPLTGSFGIYILLENYCVLAVFELTKLITLMPDVRLKEEKRNRDEPHAVGALIMDRGLLHVLLPFPADALMPALQALTAGKLRYVTIDGSPLHYRQGSIKYFSLD